MWIRIMTRNDHQRALEYRTASTCLHNISAAWHCLPSGLRQYMMCVNQTSFPGLLRQTLQHEIFEKKKSKGNVAVILLFEGTNFATT